MKISIIAASSSLFALLASCSGQQTTSTLADRATDETAPQAELEIVGGLTVTSTNRYPYVASLQSLESDPATGTKVLGHLCGATLIAPQWVVTAGHCITGIPGTPQEGQVRPASDLSVVVGQLDLSRQTGTRIKITQVVRSPKYDDFTLQNDIALLKLEKPATSIRTIGLRRDFRSVLNGIVLGWGVTERVTPEWEARATRAFLKQGMKGARRIEAAYLSPAEWGGSNVLKELWTPTLTNDQCAATYKQGIQDAIVKYGQDAVGAGPDDAFIFPDMLCGKPSNIRDSCFGDSGGPMIEWAGAENGYVLTALVSTGVGCAVKSFPGIYQRLSPHIDFISRTTGLTVK